ncbi:hypothetical protein Hanom_Chr16g01501531 [Helianthus anomalus]
MSEVDDGDSLGEPNMSISLNSIGVRVAGIVISFCSGKTPSCAGDLGAFGYDGRSGSFSIGILINRFN